MPKRKRSYPQNYRWIEAPQVCICHPIYRNEFCPEHFPVSSGPVARLNSRDPDYLGATGDGVAGRLGTKKGTL